MRLLNVLTFELVEYLAPPIPPYAILSHRWEDEEVLFPDMSTKSYRRKKGFQKIRSACQQANRDGLGFLWVDTCGIDKSSSAELSESINSMFRWYQEAEICYAYLSDVKKSDTAGDAEHAFATSAWFKRGWTLQELIAPTRLDFYALGWSYLGSRERLKTAVAHITGVDHRLLTYEERPQLRQFSIAQRMSWAASRETTRPEDRAYSLMGLFGVNMPLIYAMGEGERAFIRLQEEIIKSGTDLSILAWNASVQDGYQTTQLLASSPADFVDCGNVVRCPSLEQSPFSETVLTMSNIGLRIDSPLIAPVLDFSDQLTLSLECRYKDDVTRVIGLQLRPLDRNVHSRLRFRKSKKNAGTLFFIEWGNVGEFSGSHRLTMIDLMAPATSTMWPTFTISEELESPLDSVDADKPNSFTHAWFKIPRDDDFGWRILDVYPLKLWNRENCTFDFQNATESETKTISGIGWAYFSIAIAHSTMGCFSLHMSFTHHPLYPFLGDALRARISDYDDSTFQSSFETLDSLDGVGNSSILKTADDRIHVRIQFVRRQGIRIALFEINAHPSGVESQSESDSVESESE